MRDSKKYPMGGICKFENFPECFVFNLTRFPLDTLGGIDEWCLELLRYTDNDGTIWLVPFINCKLENQNLGVHYFIEFINNNSSKSRKTEGKAQMKPKKDIIGERLLMSEILDERNGWLNNGTLSIDVGIHVESIRENDEIWRFNFHDEIFDYHGKQKICLLYNNTDNEVRYSYLQLLTFHSPYFSERRYETDGGCLVVSMDPGKGFTVDILEKVLQIGHGVQLQTITELTRIINLALSLKLSNVVRYCEQKMIEGTRLTGGNLESIRLAIKFNLHHYLAHLLRIVSLSEITEFNLTEKDIQKMSSESLKLMVQKIFSDLC